MLDEKLNIQQEITIEKTQDLFIEDKPGKLDTGLNNFISKKLFVWSIATILLFTGDITADHWISISMGYIGVQSVVDLANAWKGK